MNDFTHFVHLNWDEFSAMTDEDRKWLKNENISYVNDVESDGSLFGFKNEEDKVKFILKFKGE